ncbi:MAG: RNA-binding transcriptional accessory protein, partial [Caldilineaceae bacterium]|nr:RNA-binding transcriptional accessory protein [Caldilineaceae bacterium]
MDQQLLIRTIARDLNLQVSQVTGAVELLDEGNTIPFIARYRKERTGVLDEEQLRAVEERLNYLRTLDERKQTVLASIEEQGKLTAELRQSIEAAETLQAVEDIYLPYRPKRRTRATVARELGLEPLAQILLAQPVDQNPDAAARGFLTADVPDVAAALAGARDIVAEQVAETATVRQYARDQYYQKGDLSAEVKEDPERKYETYHQFSTPVNKLQPHQVLALNRGEHDKALKVSFVDPKASIVQLAERLLEINPRSPFAAHLKDAVDDGYERLLKPAVEREVRRALTDAADDHAIDAFQKNLRSLLLQPPLKNRTVMGVDPAYRTGCKIAVCDATGKVLDTVTVYPHQPQNRRQEALNVMEALLHKHNVGAVAIGNGTAS